MSSVYRRGFDLDPRNAGPAAKWGTLAMVAATVLFNVTQRTAGFGVMDLIYSDQAILSGQIWRLFTYPLVYTSGLGLLFGALIYFLFARTFESQWGTRDFVKFVALSSIGAAILAIPLGFLLNGLMLFQEIGLYGGAGPAIDALLVALALNAPNANILFGFVLPMRAKNAVYILIGVKVVFALVDGTATLSMTLGGFAMGYLLITGFWRPDRWARLFKKTPPRRRGLYVVPPKEDQTLH